jgi:hypothetical protein
VHFLTFIPDCHPAEIEARAQAAGLLDLLGGHNAIPCMDGPAGSAGITIAHMGVPGSRHDYSPAEQEWVPSILKIDGKPAYWVGFWKKEQPLEGELRRYRTQAGPFVQFGASRWKLPTPDTVDARAVYADDGSMRWEVIRQFAWMCDESKQIHDEYLQPDQFGLDQFGLREMVFRVDPSVQVAWLLKLLRVNYRLLPEVAVRLDMWTGKDHIMDTFLETLGLRRKVNADG